MIIQIPRGDVKHNEKKTLIFLLHLGARGGKIRAEIQNESR